MKLSPFPDWIHIHGFAETYPQNTSLALANNASDAILPRMLGGSVGFGVNPINSAIGRWPGRVAEGHGTSIACTCAIATSDRKQPMLCQAEKESNIVLSTEQNLGVIIYDEGARGSYRCSLVRRCEAA